jgi:hypothetical protein
MSGSEETDVEKIEKYDQKKNINFEYIKLEM